MADFTITESVQKPTHWVNGLEILEKTNGKLWVCINPRPLNKAIKRQYLHFPTAKEFKFSHHLLYCQIKVYKQSSNLLAFDTTSSRYLFKHLSYGIHSASDVFQREVASIILDIPGSANSQDNFAVWEKTLQEHDEHLRKVLLKIRERGLKLN